MTRWTIVLIFAGVLLGALATVAAWRSETRAPSPQPSIATAPDRHGEDVANLSAKVGELERALAGMKEQRAQQSSPQPPSPLPQAAAPASPEEDVDSRAKLEQANAKWKEYMAVVGRSFEGEKLDLVWSKQTTSQVSAAFEANSVLHDAVPNIDCRERTCRVQIDDTDRKVSPQMSSIAGKLGKSLPNIVADRIDQGGHSVMVLYMTAGQFPKVTPAAN